MNLDTKRLIAAAAATILSACGGGGSGGGTDPGGTLSSGLSTTQTNFEASTKNDAIAGFDWYLPTSNVAPVPGTAYFLYATDSIASSPASGAVQDQHSLVDLASTLSMPPTSRLGVSRVLKNGTIQVVNDASKQVWTYSGQDVVATTYAADGTTPLLSGEYDDWSAPIPLAGTIDSATVLKSFFGFLRFDEPLNYDFSKTWLAGSSYITRKGFQSASALFLRDWSGSTYDAGVTPYPGSETTIEAMFANPGYAGGIVVDHVPYVIGSGSISTIEGARVWVASNPRPASASPTEGFVAFAELHGAIYFGTFRKAGARFKTIDGVDSTIVHDYSVRVNVRAAESIQQTVKY